MAEQNSLNNSSSIFVVDNLTLDANTLSSTSGDLIIESDATNEIQFYNGTATVLNMTSAGEMTLPLQPTFLSYLPTTDLNKTGDGTSYTIGSVTAVTEITDQGGDFNVNGTFTAPVAGNYLFIGTVAMTGGTATFMLLTITTSNRVWRSDSFDYTSVASGDTVNCQVICLADMDAEDTATFNTVADNSVGDDVDIIGASSSMRTYFSGSLIA